LAGAEHSWRRWVLDPMLGSPPRVCATLLIRPERLPPLPFIPARVGNRPSTVDVSLLIAVHPHACWEQAAGGVVGRTWQRFIPTRVGNRSMRSMSVTYLRGSSPRVWGTGRAERVGLRDHRFIP